MTFDTTRKWWIIQLRDTGDKEWNGYFNVAYVPTNADQSVSYKGGRYHVYENESLAANDIKMRNLQRADQDARPIEVTSDVIRSAAKRHGDTAFNLTTRAGTTVVSVASIWPEN